jgi:hypothetical protein
VVRFIAFLDGDAGTAWTATGGDLGNSTGADGASSSTGGWNLVDQFHNDPSCCSTATLAR